jgi:hypothetical protein
MLCEDGKVDDCDCETILAEICKENNVGSFVGDGKVEDCDCETILPEICKENNVGSFVGEFKYELIVFTPWLK